MKNVTTGSCPQHGDGVRVNVLTGRCVACEVNRRVEHAIEDGARNTTHRRRVIEDHQERMRDREWSF